MNTPVCSIEFNVLINNKPKIIFGISLWNSDKYFLHIPSIESGTSLMNIEECNDELQSMGDESMTWMLLYTFSVESCRLYKLYNNPNDFRYTMSWIDKNKNKSATIDFINKKSDPMGENQPSKRIAL